MPAAEKKSLSPAPRGEHFVFRQLLQCSQRAGREKLPQRFALQYGCLPLGVHEGLDGNYLSVLLADTLNERERKELQFITGYPLSATRFGESDAEKSMLMRAIELLYNQDVCEQDLVLVKGADRHRESEWVQSFFRSVALEAVAQRSSDIHIEYTASEVSLRFRIRGELHQLQQYQLSREEVQHVIRHIKVLARLDARNFLQPQEGIFEFVLSRGSIRMRLSTIPLSGGEKLVLRLMQNGCLEELQDKPFSQKLKLLGVFAEQELIIQQYLAAQRGALLVSGPTGSGKSTLLYTIVSALCQPEQNVISIEDPVEARIPDASQVDISELSLGFEEMLVRVLRQDPDALLLGEIRTQEAAKTALQAAIAGTKVCSSIHAGSCFEVILRLLELGMSPGLLGLGLHTISSQRLLPKVCSHCTQERTIDSSTAVAFQLPEDTKVFQPQSCTRCLESGRVAVFEFLYLSESLKGILRANAEDRLKAFAQQAYREGYRSYGYYVRELLREGSISPQTAHRALGMPGPSSACTP